MKWPLEKKIIASGFALAILIFSIVSTLSYQNTTKLFDRQKQVEQTYQVLQKVRALLSTLRDAERARRGYIITGKEIYLKSYNTDLQAIRPKFNEVRRLTFNNPRQQQRLDKIEPLIAERVALLKKSVELYQQNQSDRDTQIALTDKVLMLHDKIWQVIAQMETEEQLLLQSRAAESEASFRDTMLINITGWCLSFILLLLVYTLLHRQIDKRQQTEETLRESEQRYRDLFDFNPQPLWVYDLKTLDFLAVNDAAIHDYGYAKADFLAMRIHDIHLPEDMPAFLNAIAEYTPEVQRVQIERHLKRDGTIIDVETTSQRLMFGGRLAMLVLARDITKEKQAQEALQASEEKFRQIAENVHEVFWIGDVKLNKIIYINPVYEKIWGRSCKSLYENSQSFLDAIHQEDRFRVIATFEENIVKEHEIEYRIVQPDGSIRWIWAHGFPVKNAKGEIYRRIEIAQDITERKRIEEVRHTLEKERELSELKLRFFSMASHEFRTPLSTILVSAQLLENCSKDWSAEKKFKNLYRIQSAAKTMTQLLTDILTLARAESGKLEFNPELLDLEKLSSDILEEVEISNRLQERIIFISNCPSRQAYVDEKLLRSLITNLLSNAIKYSLDNTPIYFTITCESGQAIFTIKDQGIGIPPEDQKNLYQSFYRGKNVGDVSGTGLGLAVVKKCVELHGGSIAVESEVGVGTTFTVTIPWNTISGRI